MSRWPQAKRVQSLKPTAVNRVLQEVRDAQRAGRTIISLMRGQPDSPTPPHIVAAAQQALLAGHTGYPDNQGELILRKAVAEKLKRDHGLAYDPATEILVTDGATSALFTAFGVLIQEGDEVLLPDPIYDAYTSPIAIWGGCTVPVKTAIRNGRFVLDSAALQAAVTPRSRVLLVNTPWNPTGTVLSAGELRDIMTFAAARDLAVISDEIYETLIYDNRRHASAAAASGDGRSRTLLVNSLSKTYAMTGWRVGYCAGPADMIAAMLLVLQQFSRGPATFVQHAAAAALSGDQACVQDMAREYQERRDLTVRTLSGIHGIIPLVPEGGLFVMLDVRSLGMSSDEVRRYLLREAGVTLIHGAAYGAGGEGTLRVSFAGGGKTLTDGLSCLREGLERLAKRAVS